MAKETVTKMQPAKQPSVDPEPSLPEIHKKILEGKPLTEREGNYLLFGQLEMQPGADPGLSLPDIYKKIIDGQPGSAKLAEE